MNCKKGDLAVIVRGEFSEYVGTLVDVLRPYDGKHYAGFGPAWWVRQVGTDDVRHCDDCFLRPIRDNDGEDETLTWAGKPNHIEVTQ